MASSLLSISLFVNVFTVALFFVVVGDSATTRKIDFDL
jgi:hypothetical protein